MKNPSSPQPTNAQARDAPGDPALKALRLSESRYRRLFETAQDGILLLNADTAQIEDVNPYLIEMLGYSHAEFLGKKLWEVGSFADIAQSKEMFAQLQTQGYVRYKDLPLKTKAGAIVPVEFVSNAYDCEGLTVIQCNIRNISERHADREKIQRQTRLYAALSQCNYAIMHCASEEDLFLEICRAAVRTGGVKMAWVGLIDAETRMVRPVASVGDETGYLKSVNISVDADSPFGPSPTGTAIGRDEPSWCQDFLNDPMTVTWHERAARAGLAASASLPLHRNGGVVGAFTLSAGEVNAFDESARALLVEMTANISFALDNFAGEFRRQQAEEEIVFKNTILQTQQETLLDAMLVLDENQGILSFNQHFIDLWPLPPHLLIARLDAPVLQAVADQTANPAAFLERIDYLKHHRDETSREEVALKDGRIIDRYCAPAVGADGKYYGRVWYFRDITERKKAEQKFKDLLEAAPDAMVIVNQDAVILLLNAQAVHLFGWRREDLLGQKVDILVPKLLRRKHPEKRNTFFENPRARPMGAGLELFGLRKDGTEFPVEISLSPLDTAEGTLVIAAIRDITERKHGERLVRDSEKRFRAIFDQAPIATALLDRQGRPIISNSHLSKMVGYSNDELSKMTFADFTYPEDVDKDLNQFDELIEGKISAYNMEKRYVHKNGSLIWANLFVTLLRGEHGLPQDVIGMAEDITERKRSEISIKRLNRVYAVLSSINSLIVRVRDPDELFREACRIAVDAGGFRMSLIAMVDQRTMRTVPVASAGKDAALLSAVHGLLSSSEIAPNSMVARATREKTAVVANDSIGDPQVLLGDQYADAGVRSMAVLPLIVSEQAVGVLALYASERDFFLEDEMKLLTELTFVATDLNDDLDDRLLALRTFADGLTPALLDRKAERQTVLEGRSFLLNLFNDGVIVVDAGGMVIADVPLWRARTGRNWMDRDYVDAALRQGKPSVGRPVPGQNSGLPSIGMAVPIRDHEGKVIGAVAGLINLAEPSFMDHVSRHGYGKSGDVLVASRQHRVVITGSDQRRVMEQLPAQGVDPAVDARAAGRDGTEVLVNRNGVEVLSSARAVPAADWFVEISLPTQEAFSPIREVQRRMLLAALFLTLLAGVMSWWMVRRQLSPMLAAVRELARSQPNHRQRPLTITHQDEIGRLLGAFNRVVATLDQHDALLKQILDTSSVAIFLVDSQGRITQANRRMAEMFGYSPDTLVGLEYVALVDPAERELAQKSMLALLASAVPAVESDRLYWRADHSTLWGHLSSQRFIDADGHEQGLIGVIADISARKATEELIRQHDNRLTAIIENFPGGISMIDPALRLVTHNQQYKKLLNFPDALFEKPDLGLEDLFRFNARRGEYGPGDVEQQVSEHAARARKFEPHKFEHVRPDGTVLEVQGALVPGGGFVTIYLDITERKRKDDALRNSELSLRRFRVAMDATQDAIFIVDRASMRFVDVNASACRMLELTHEQILAAGPDGVLGTSRRRLADIYDSVIAGHGVPMTIEALRTRQDGKKRWVEISRHAQRSDETWTIVTVARDITERKRAERALRESAQELRLFADNVPAMTAAFDAGLHFTFVNRRYAESLAQGRTDLIGKHLREVVGESVYREIEGYFVQVLQGHPVTYQRLGRLQNHEAGHLQVKLMPNIGEQGKVLGCFTVTTDITEHKQAEERIQRVAHHDSLTGLPNRLLFGDRLEQAISIAKRESRQFALLYLDLDKFKPVNDTLGHAIGDELLQAVADRLRRQVRESDTVARIGGDEFAVILFSIARPEEAQGVANKISVAIATPFQLASQKESITIGVSIGITIYPTDGAEAAALIVAADQAMYRAKEAGGNASR